MGRESAVYTDACLPQRFDRVVGTTAAGTREHGTAGHQPRIRAGRANVSGGWFTAFGGLASHPFQRPRGSFHDKQTALRHPQRFADLLGDLLARLDGPVEGGFQMVLDELAKLLRVPRERFEDQRRDGVDQVVVGPPIERGASEEELASDEPPVVADDGNDPLASPESPSPTAACSSLPPEM